MFVCYFYCSSISHGIVTCTVCVMWMTFEIFQCCLLLSASSSHTAAKQIFTVAFSRCSWKAGQLMKLLPRFFKATQGWWCWALSRSVFLNIFLVLWVCLSFSTSNRRGMTMEHCKFLHKIQGTKREKAWEVHSCKIYGENMKSLLLFLAVLARTFPLFFSFTQKYISRPDRSCAVDGEERAKMTKAGAWERRGLKFFAKH